jgi:hypothetical protein
MGAAAYPGIIFFAEYPFQRPVEIGKSGNKIINFVFLSASLSFELLAELLPPDFITRSIPGSAN